ncbi:rod shape-determining protein MreD [Capnocytophaga sp. ARDL2]|uniref:rod shape-determining protein MreD n=1 Tax=Capnocytophaga sp. ARDL2 TaxID=3238809 RepID=UPI0035574EE0
MNNTTLLALFRFVSLLILQVVLFNYIHFLGYAVPYPYILFILLFPLQVNRKWLLIASFCMGIILDIFNDSGGVHATACLSVAYFREYFIKISYGISYEYHMLKISSKISKELISYLFVSILFHHLVFYTLEAFSLLLIIDVLLKTVSSLAVTFLFSLLLIALSKSDR